MGLDTVELTMAVEEWFDLEIADEDAERFFTVGDMYEFLCGTLGYATPRPCESQRAFHRVRKALVRTAEVPRWYVRPARRLDDLLSAFPAKRKLALRRLQNEIGFRINADPGEVVTVGSVVRLAVARGESARRFANHFPVEGWDRLTIWQAMHALIVETLSVPSERVTLSARFVDDLCCD
jgi:acyl carrier protein